MRQLYWYQNLRRQRPVLKLLAMGLVLLPFLYYGSFPLLRYLPASLRLASTPNPCNGMKKPYDFDTARGVNRASFNPGDQCEYGLEVTAGVVQILDLRGKPICFPLKHPLPGKVCETNIAPSTEVADTYIKVAATDAVTVTATAGLDVVLCPHDTKVRHWMCMRG